MGSPAVEWPCLARFVTAVAAARAHGSLVSQVRNELTMYGRVGTLADDLIRSPCNVCIRKSPISIFVEHICAACRWSDGSVWARCDTDAAWKQPLLER